jgi:hypothetical protein
MQRLGAAVLALAASADPIQARLSATWSELVHLTPGDFPDAEERAIFEDVMRRFAAASGDEDAIRPSAMAMDDAEAVRTARDITLLHGRVAAGFFMEPTPPSASVEVIEGLHEDEG